MARTNIWKDTKLIYIGGMLKGLSNTSVAPIFLSVFAGHEFPAYWMEAGYGASPPTNRAPAAEQTDID